MYNQNNRCSYNFWLCLCLQWLQVGEKSLVMLLLLVLVTPISTLAQAKQQVSGQASNEPDSKLNGQLTDQMLRLTHPVTAADIQPWASACMQTAQRHADETMVKQQNLTSRVVPQNGVYLRQQWRPLLVEMPAKVHQSTSRFDQQFYDQQSSAQHYQPVDLIVAFHGRTNSATKVRSYYDIEQPDRHVRPTIVVYPQGLTDKSGRYTWWSPGESTQHLNGVALFDEIVQQFRQDYCVVNVYVVGYSLGASITNTIGCQRGDQIRAIASLGGGIEGGVCQGQVAALLLHNPADQLVPIRYGLAARRQLLSAHEASLMPDEKVVDALTPLPPVPPVPPIGFLCQRYAGGYNPLLWCPHQNSFTRWGRYYPHNWPQGTGTIVLNFFANLP